MAQQDEMSVVLYVGRHRLEASLKTDGYRLLDILNDRLKEFLELHEVRVAAGDSEFGSPMSHAVVAKARVTLAAILVERHEAEERRRFSTVDKGQHAARAIVGGYEIEGEMHLEASPDPTLALSGELDNFFAITRASIVDPASGHRAQTQVAMPNKAELAFLHIAQPERAMRIPTA